jgi:SAM-dependent methyltransferase
MIMLNYLSQPVTKISYDGTTINSFIKNSDLNVDAATVNSFGEEWKSFHSFDDAEIEKIGDEYFNIVGDEQVNQNSIVLDVGCGSGRWSAYISKKAKFVEAIDPSAAIFSAVDLVKGKKNIRITQAGVDFIPFADDSFDFVFSLGVLHHVPDTEAAMQACIKKLKPGGHFLVYLYYNFDNRGLLFKILFQVVDFLRKGISKLPGKAKRCACDVIALLVYFPIAKTCWLVRKVFRNSWYKKIPLSYYHDKSFYIMRNDALDRFGTPLEKRFSKKQVETMMINSGLTKIVFSSDEPYWHALGQKRTDHEQN